MPPKRNTVVHDVYGRIPNKVENYESINNNVNEYIKNTSNEELAKVIDIANFLYHSHSSSGLEDNTWDSLNYHLEKRMKLEERKNNVGALPITKLRTQLEYEMPSLTKLNPTTCVNYLLHHTNLMWSNKLDGISGMLTYINGQLTKVNTRGNGLIGGNINDLIPHLNIIKTIKNDQKLVVRGEFIISKNNSQYNNRAAVSGKLNSGFVSKNLHLIDFVAYSIVDDGEKMLPSPTTMLATLKDLGFNVVQHGTFCNPTLFDIITLYKDNRKSSTYYIDGLVLTDNIPRLPSPKVTDLTTPPTCHHSVAFKMRLDEQVRKTKVVDVDWGITKTGRYFPVVVYEPVYINSTELHRATGHNANHIKNWHIGKGTKIEVIKSGDVLPIIKHVDVDINIDIIYPTRYEYHWDGKDIMLNDIDNNREVQIQRLYHFFKTIGVKQLGEKMAETLHDCHYTTIFDVARLKVNDFKKIKGIGDKKANTFVTGIQHGLTHATPDRLIYATSLSVHLGRKILHNVFKRVPDMLNYNKDQIITYFKKNKIPGIGEKRIQLLSTCIPEIKKYLDGFGEDTILSMLTNYKKILHQFVMNENIKGKRFVLTGFMCYDTSELEDYIEDHGGVLTDKVNKNIDAIIYYNVNDFTTKMEEAQQFNLVALTLDEFKHRYQVDI